MNVGTVFFMPGQSFSECDLSHQGLLTLKLFSRLLLHHCPKSYSITATVYIAFNKPVCHPIIHL